MARLLRSLAATFMPPFTGLGLIAVLYVAWAHLVYPHNDVLRGNFPDPDDYMYLDQVLDWVQGQGWYDNIQHRLDPPNGVPIHFSRFAQMPMALCILLFEKLGLPTHGAATVTALLYPLCLLGLFFVTLRKTSAYLIPQDWAGVSTLPAFFSIGLLYEFMPGHVDHHGLVIILVMAALGCLLRLIDEPEVTIGLLMGGLMAFTLMIALEILPWVLLLSGCYGLWCIGKGGKTAKSGAAFGLSFLLGSIACLAVTRPPSGWLEIDPLTYSVVYVLLAASIAAPFAGVALAKNSPLTWRALIGLILTGICGGLFLHHFPEMVSGPYGDIDPQLVPILLNSVEEAKPILQTENGLTHFFDFLTMGFISLATTAIFVWRSAGNERVKWALVGLMLTSALGLTIFYQYRFLGMETAFAALPLTGLLYHGWQWIRQSLSGRRKIYAEIGLLLLIGPLPAVILPALFDSRSFNTGMLLFPVDSGHSLCDTAGLEHALRDPKDLGDRPRLVLGATELGPEILFRSPHKVLAAPFHMNVQGNLDATRALSTPFVSEAENIIHRRNVDLIVVCRAVTHLYLPPKGAAPSFMEVLFTGPQPSWLEPVSLPAVKNFVVYRVRPESSSLDANPTQVKKSSGK